MDSKDRISKARDLGHTGMTKTLLKQAIKRMRNAPIGDTIELTNPETGSSIGGTQAPKVGRGRGWSMEIDTPEG